MEQSAHSYNLGLLPFFHDTEDSIPSCKANTHPNTIRLKLGLEPRLNDKLILNIIGMSR